MITLWIMIAILAFFLATIYDDLKYRQKLGARSGVLLGFFTASLIVFLVSQAEEIPPTKTCPSCHQILKENK